ncbi:MAG: amidase family protein [Candidatus Dormibacteria bacterium]
MSPAATERVAAAEAALAARDPLVGAVLEVSSSAPDEARRLDEELRRRGPRGPLHGVPVLVKGNIDVAGGGLRNTAGSLALLDTPVAGDAACVERLRAAGAVILGTTNLSEWANFRSPRSTSGWSARGGQTRNPHVLDRSPCGSSSGSAAAVAAGYVAAAVGTETDGSIVCPAAACGVAGIKPTLGLVETRGVIPIAPSQDVVGTHGRTVLDAARLLAAMAPPGVLEVTGGSADVSCLRGLRVGVLRQQYAGYSAPADAVLERAIEALGRAGAVLVDPALLPSAAELAESPAEMTVLHHEFRVALEAYLAERGDPRVRTLDDLIAFNREHADLELLHFGQEHFEAAAATAGLDAPAYRAARATCLRLAATEGIDAVMATHDLEVLLSLTGGPAWLIDPGGGDQHSGGSSELAAMAGYPAVTVPAGTVAGALPVGVTLGARAGADRRLIEVAAAVEALLGPPPRPGWLATLERGAA